MPRAEIEKFFHAVTRDPGLHRALLKRSRGPADFYPQAAKLARLLGFTFSAAELKAWAEDEGGLPHAAPAAGAAVGTGTATPDATGASSPAAAATLPAGGTGGQSHWSLRSWRLGDQR